MVEGQHLVKEHEVGVRNVEFVGGKLRKPLDLTNDVVAEEADRAGSERREAG